MRLMTITRLFAISVVLLSGTPVFAARAIHPDTRDLCRGQNAEFCRRSPFNVEIPGAGRDQPCASQGERGQQNLAWRHDSGLIVTTVISFVVAALGLTSIPMDGAAERANRCS